MYNILNKIPVFNPSNSYILLWDIIFIVIVLIFFYYVPIHLLFNINYLKLLPPALVYIKPIIILIEILITLNSGFFYQGIYIEDRL